MTWMAGRGGRRVDLLIPTSDEVDWPEIAWSLAHINRYGGHAAHPISVAQHTLIVAEMCRLAEPTRPDVIPYALLHDAHESRTGDVTRPMQETEEEAAEARFPGIGRVVIRETRSHLRDWHDLVIRRAAGIPEPMEWHRELVKHADIVALAFEREHFFGAMRSAPTWSIGGAPIPRGIPGHLTRRWPSFEAADKLVKAFHAHLPALAGRPLPNLSNYPEIAR